MGGVCSTYGGRRGTYTVVVGRYEGKEPLGKPRRRWEQILKIIFKKWNRAHGLNSSGSVG
jgi:hypothetical protein